MKFKIFTNGMNNYFDRRYTSEYFSNAFICTLFNICKIQIFIVGHFGLQIAALMSKFPDES